MSMTPADSQQPVAAVPSLADAAVAPARASTTGAQVIDMDAMRAQRAAAREGKRQDMPIVLGGKTIATLPVELPIDVVEPLRDLDEEFTLILRSAMQVVRAGGDTESKWDATQLVVDVLASNPALPVQVLDVLAKVSRNLLGDSGYEALMASKPTREDLQYLATGVLGFYGVSLGESSPPSDSSEGGGETSSTTSATTSDSTPEISTPTPASDATSESAAS